MSKQQEPVQREPQQNPEGPSGGILGQAAALPFKAALHVLKEVYNDPNTWNWLAHGANEAATVLLTGHPAPVYTRNVSPPDQSGPYHNPHIQELEQSLTPASPSQEPQIGPPTDPAAAQAMPIGPPNDPTAGPGIVDRHLQYLQARPEIHPPEQELSK